MPERDKAGRFIVGNSGGGRTQGARSRLQECMLQMLDADWREHGQEVLERVRERWPQVYLTACISLLPKQQHIAVNNPFADVSDVELAQIEEMLKANRAQLVQQIEACARTAKQIEAVAIELEPEDATTDSNEPS
jgi:hypothetical protein